MEVEIPRLPKFRRMPGRILIERRQRKPIGRLSAHFRGYWEGTAQNDKSGTRVCRWEVQCGALGRVGPNQPWKAWCRNGEGFASTMTSHGGILIVLESSEVSLGRPAEKH